MAKQTDLNQRMTVWINKELKKVGDDMIYEFGLKPTTVITMLYQQIVRQRKIPFDIKAREDLKNLYYLDDNGKLVLMD